MSVAATTVIVVIVIPIAGASALFPPAARGFRVALGVAEPTAMAVTAAAIVIVVTR
jgi:hypothetical protein